MKSCVARQQQMCRFQAGQPGVAEFKKQNNQVHAGMCWHVLVCASTKCRKFEHVKVCTSIYWYIFYTFNFIQSHTISYRFIPILPHTIPNMRIYDYIPGMPVRRYVLLHTKTLIFVERLSIYRYIQVCIGTYVYKPGGQDSR